MITMLIFFQYRQYLSIDFHTRERSCWGRCDVDTRKEPCHYQLEIDDLRMIFVLYSNELVEERISCFQFSSIPYGVEMFR